MPKGPVQLGSPLLFKSLGNERGPLGGVLTRWYCRASHGGDQWWPWPLVISLYSSGVGFGMTLSSP